MHDDAEGCPEWELPFLVTMLSSHRLSSMLNAQLLTLKVNNNSLLQSLSTQRITKTGV